MVEFEGLVAQGTTQWKSRYILISPPRKNALDYLLILILVGCLGKMGWDFYHTRILNEAIAPYVIAALVTFMALNRQKKPKVKQFSCARCKSVANFDARTIQAWNNGFVKLYCDLCHQHWLHENPVLSKRSHAAWRDSGCLVLLIVLTVAPVLAGVAVYQLLV